MFKKNLLTRCMFQKVKIFVFFFFWICNQILIKFFFFAGTQNKGAMSISFLQEAGTSRLQEINFYKSPGTLFKLVPNSIS